MAGLAIRLPIIRLRVPAPIIALVIKEKCCSIFTAKPNKECPLQPRTSIPTVLVGRLGHFDG